MYCLAVFKMAAGYAALTSNGGWDCALPASDCNHLASSLDGPSSGRTETRFVVTEEMFECAELLAPSVSCSGGLSSFLGFGRLPLAVYCGLSPFFSTEKVLASQLCPLEQPGRALQIGMRVLRMSSACESPNEQLCCREQLEGTSLVIGICLLFCRRGLKLGGSSHEENFGAMTRWTPRIPGCNGGKGCPHLPPCTEVPACPAARGFPPPLPLQRPAAPWYGVAPSILR